MFRQKRKIEKRKIEKMTTEETTAGLGEENNMCKMRSNMIGKKVTCEVTATTIKIRSQTEDSWRPLSLGESPRIVIVTV